MPDLDLGPIKERCAKATQGPWILGPFCGVVALYRNGGRREIVLDSARSGMKDATFRLRDHARCVMEKVDPRGPTDQVEHPDAIFLAASRTDIPALVAEVERLREALRVEREACDEWRGAAPKDVQLTDGITSPQWMPCHHGLAVCAVKHDARRAEESPYGLSVVVDNSVPPGVVELRQGGKVVGRITDIGDDRRAKEPT